MCQEKEWTGYFLNDLRVFGINADQWTAAAQDDGEWSRTAEQAAKHFIAKWIAAEKNKAGLRHAVVCPNVTGRTKERIAQSKRVRAGSLALVDLPQVARTCALRAFGLQMSRRLSLVLRLFYFASFSSLFYAFVEAAALRSIVLRHAGTPIATRTCSFLGGEMSLFPSIFCTISAFSLYGEYVVHSFLPNDMGFSTL